VNAAPIDVARAMRSAKGFALGRTKSRQAEALAQWRDRGVTPAGVSAISLGAKAVVVGDTPQRCVRVHVPKKLAPAAMPGGAKLVPSAFADAPSDVVENVAAVAAAPGSSAKYALSAYSGTLTYVFEHGGTRYAMSCSHVFAPADVSPQSGDGCLVDVATATLAAWSKLDDSAGALVADVALASTAVDATTAWPDGAPFQGTADYASQNGPFSVFGNINQGSASSGSSLSGPLNIDVHGFGSCMFTSLFTLEIAIGEGDSGAAVRDKDGRLVGMIIARESSTSYALCTPWQSIQPVLASLLT
jgi:hypothetical protein